MTSKSIAEAAIYRIARTSFDRLPDAIEYENAWRKLKEQNYRNDRSFTIRYSIPACLPNLRCLSKLSLNANSERGKRGRKRAPVRLTIKGRDLWQGNLENRNKKMREEKRDGIRKRKEERRNSTAVLTRSRGLVAGPTSRDKACLPGRE